jgi:phosphohistidine phosphatase SixA
MMSETSSMLGAAPSRAHLPVVTGSHRLRGEALANALRRGGYVIVLRHAAANHAHPDQAHPNLAKCSTQEPLTATGIAQARQIGRAVRALKLPIGRVLYSPYCRTRTTARLAFGKVGQSSRALIAAGYPGVNHARQDAQVRALLNTRPQRGTDSGLVTHANTLRNAKIPVPAEGGAEIYKPRPGHQPLMVAELSPAQWTGLAKASPRR